MKWIYAEKSGIQHEIQESDFPSLIASGKITKDTLVWNETMSDWRRCGDIRPNLFDRGASPPGLSASERQQVRAHSPQAPGSSLPLDGMALCSMIFGILGIVTCILLFAIPAVICGHLSLKKTNAEPGNPSNRGLAITGLITGYIGIFFLFLFVLYIIFVVVIGISVGLEDFENF